MPALARRVVSRETLILAVLALPLQVRADAFTYRFSSRSTGAYRKQMAGTATVDGLRCRLDFDSAAGPDTELTSIVCANDGSFVALNANNRTWFRLKSRSRVAITSVLFSFRDANASNIRVKALALDTRDLRENVAAHVEFAYDIRLTEEAEIVTGRVWGSIRVWVSTSNNPHHLPWDPLAVATGHSNVDQELRSVLLGIPNPRGSEITLSRTLGDGPALTETITRNIDSLVSHPARSDTFVVPSEYRYQEPVYGVPPGQ